MNDIIYIKGYRGVSEIFGMFVPKSRTVLIYEVGCYMKTPMVFYNQFFEDCEEISEKEFVRLLHDHLELIIFEDTLAEIVRVGKEQDENQLQRKPRE